MTGIDTNVLVRYITQDDAIQADIATRYVELNCTAKSPGFVNHIVLCELIWVLKRCYKVNQHQAMQIIEQLLRTVQLRIQEPQIVWAALKSAQKDKADFSDVMITRINLAHGCGKTVTFDKAAAEIRGTTQLTS